MNTYSPSYKKELKKTTWGGNKTAIKTIEEKIIVQSKSCPNCGKSKKEIEKALKQGISPSREDIIKRAKEAGLPLRF